MLLHKVEREVKEMIPIRPRVSAPSLNQDGGIYNLIELLTINISFCEINKYT